MAAEPALTQRINQLRGAIENYTAAPSAWQLAQIKILQAKLEEASPPARRLAQDDLAALNKLMNEAGVPHINPPRAAAPPKPPARRMKIRRRRSRSYEVAHEAPRPSVAPALGVGCGGNTSESPTASTPSPTPRAGCDPSGPSLVLVVDPAIEGGIRASLATFVADLCRDGYAVVKNVEAYESPADLRRYLARVYSETQGRLRGAILVGNHPRAYQWVTALSSNPRIPDLSEEVISFQYYADLDGVFEASPSYRSRRAYSFDVHAGEVDWEIGSPCCRCTATTTARRWRP